MSGDGIRGLLHLAGAAVAAPDKLSEAWVNLTETDRAALGNGALERITKVFANLKYNPNEEFATFAKDAGQLGTQSVLSHLPSDLGMQNLVTFRKFLKLMVQQHWIAEDPPADKPDAEDSQLQVSLSAQRSSLEVKQDFGGNRCRGPDQVGFPH